MDNGIYKPRRFFDSSVEQQCYIILQELINTEFYTIIPHIHLKDVFDIKEEKSIFWRHYHVDFAIIDTVGYPVAGIEIHGPKHWNSPTSKDHDKIKKSLFLNADIPLITIPVVEIPYKANLENIDTYKTNLKKLLVSNLAQLSNKTSYPSYCWHCGQTLSQKFRNDDPSIRFFACTNKDCKCRTLSEDKIHEIIKCNI